jgi:hypothetical protein
MPLITWPCTSGRAADGENYFGSEAPVVGGPRSQAVTRLIEGQSMTFNQRTGQPR